MAGFLKKILGSGVATASKSRAQLSSVTDYEVIDVAKLTEILGHFQLGEKIRYYPEQQTDSALDTIIMAYGVNQQLIYSPIDIRCQLEGEREVVSLTTDGEESIIDEVKKFCFAIPLNHDDDNKRTYVRRAELGPRGPFRRGNTVTLIACTSGGALSTIDTVVRKVMPLKHGIYAGHEVVLLDALPDTLTLTDQRQYYRLQTSIPAILSMGEAGSHNCALVDFSEGSVQLHFEDSNASLKALTKSHQLILKIDVGIDGQHKVYVVEGRMYRKTDTSLVMKLKGIYKGGDLPEPIGLVDILEIKASLLRHPETQKLLDTKK